MRAFEKGATDRRRHRFQLSQLLGSRLHHAELAQAALQSASLIEPHRTPERPQQPRPPKEKRERAPAKEAAAAAADTTAVPLRRGRSRAASRNRPPPGTPFGTPGSRGSTTSPRRTSASRRRPSATSRISAMRPRGLLRSHFVSSYVGHVGKHMPQCMHCCSTE